VLEERDEELLEEVDAGVDVERVTLDELRLTVVDWVEALRLDVAEDCVWVCACVERVVRTVRVTLGLAVVVVCLLVVVCVLVVAFVLALEGAVETLERTVAERTEVLLPPVEVRSVATRAAFVERSETPSLEERDEVAVEEREEVAVEARDEAAERDEVAVLPESPEREDVDVRAA